MIHGQSHHFNKKKKNSLHARKKHVMNKIVLEFWGVAILLLEQLLLKWLAVAFVTKNNKNWVLPKWRQEKNQKGVQV